MKFTTPFTFDKSTAFEHPKGRSQFIPQQGTDLIDLVRRSQINAMLPSVAQAMEKGEDEDFDDAFDQESMDLVDYGENLDFIGRTQEKLKAAKEAAKKAKAEKDKESTTKPSEVADMPENLD